jgi:hypothetical protein
MRLGLSHSQTTLLLGGVTFGFLILGVVLRQSGDHVVLPMLVSLSIGLSVLLDMLIRNRVTKETPEP